MKIKTIKDINKYQNKVVVYMEYKCDNFIDTINIKGAVKNSLGLLTVQYGNIVIAKHIAAFQYGVIASIIYMSYDNYDVDNIYNFLAEHLGSIEGFFNDEKDNVNEFYDSIEECGHVLDELENRIKIKKGYKESSDDKKTEREATCTDIINKLDEMKPSREKDKEIIDKLNSYNTSINDNDNLKEDLKKAIGKSNDDALLSSDKNANELDIKARCYDLIKDRIEFNENWSETIKYIEGVVETSNNILDYLKTLK